MKITCENKTFVTRGMTVTGKKMIDDGVSTILKYTVIFSISANYDRDEIVRGRLRGIESEIRISISRLKRHR